MQFSTWIILKTLQPQQTGLLLGFSVFPSLVAVATESLHGWLGFPLKFVAKKLGPKHNSQLNLLLTRYSTTSCSKLLCHSPGTMKLAAGQAGRQCTCRSLDNHQPASSTPLAAWQVGDIVRIAFFCHQKSSQSSSLLFLLYFRSYLKNNCVRPWRWLQVRIGLCVGVCAGVSVCQIIYHN